MVHIPRPIPGEVAAHFASYVDLVPEGDLLAHLERQEAQALALLAGIPEARGGFRYAPGKWSIKDLVGHLADTERIMGYRLLCIARGEQQSLPGFAEDDYVRAAQADARPLEELIGEFAAVRRASLALVRGLDSEAWLRRGSSNGKAVSAADMGYVIAGHLTHHLKVLEERYLG